VLDLSWSLYNGSVTELDFTGERWGLRTFNSTAHLVDKRLVTSVEAARADAGSPRSPDRRSRRIQLRRLRARRMAARARRGPRARARALAVRSRLLEPHIPRSLRRTRARRSEE